MLGNIGKICQDKKEYILRHHTNTLKKQINQEEVIFQNQAIHLIQKQMKTSHLLSFIELFQTISRKGKRDSFMKLRRQSLPVENSGTSLTGQNERRIRLFLWKIYKFTTQKEKFCKLLFFKKIEKRNKMFIILQKIAIISDRFQMREKLSILKAIEHEKSFSALNFLDISEICPKEKFLSFPERSVKPTQKNLRPEQDLEDLEELSSLKKQIIRKQQEILEYEKQQEKQILKLKQRINKKKQREVSTDETFSLQKTQDVIIGKLIRKNFELEQKIQTVHELLNNIEQNKFSKFGVVLSGLIKKRYLNVEVQQIQL